MVVSIDFMFAYGEEVFLKTDPDQRVGLITGYVLRPNSPVFYKITRDDTESSHYDFEITTEKKY